MPSGGGSTNSTTTSSPWIGQQAYLSNVMQQAANTYDNMAGNPSASVAGFTPMQQQAMQNTQSVANGTNFNNAAGVNNAAGQFTQNLLGGQYLNSNPGDSTFSNIANGANNPYTSSAMGAANDAITRAYQTATAPQTSSAMEASGRYGSGANANAVSQNQQNLATQLGNTDASLANTMYQEGVQNQLGAAQGLSSNYNTGMQQMLGGAYSAPSTVNSITGANTNLYNMGGNQQALNQQQINAPWNLLGNYNSLIQGNYGGTTNSSQPYYNNTTGQIIGGLGTAAMMAAMFM